MKKQSIALLLLLSVAACSTPSKDAEVVEESPTVDENQIIEEQIEENRYEQTVDFLDLAEEWSAIEMVENNREFYTKNLPENWLNFNTAEDYPEHMKLYLHVWKTGVFKNTKYAGQSLVLVKQDCEGPCPASFFRYAVDEATDTWTLLADYSTKEEGRTGGPADGVDSSVEIPELDVPEELNIYDNDRLILLSAFSELYSERFPKSDAIAETTWLTEATNFPDATFQKYFKNNGCLYGILPDGVMVRYTILPKVFEEAENITGVELTFTDASGKSEEKNIALSAGGCGLSWSCLSTFELTDDEKARLKEVGTLDGRPVYLPETVGPRPAQTSETNLDRQLYGAFDSYVMAKTYSLKDEPEATAETVEAFLKMNSTFILELDNGSATLAYESKYAPAAECGKPVIYLYPQKNTVVHVEVGIDEFTKTIPDYGVSGWDVLARPNGLLTNLADNLNYPYLFWEGNSYKTLDAGETWTLSKKEVASSLPEALLGMGLNDQETTDFMEFWLPQLQAVTTPYIEFAFVNEDVMDQIAPLTITPTPDQVLRVFMFYRGVDQAGAEQPNFKPKMRQGFTVIEWGGSLY